MASLATGTPHPFAEASMPHSAAVDASSRDMLQLAPTAIETHRLQIPWYRMTCACRQLRRATCTIETSVSWPYLPNVDHGSCTVVALV